MMKIRTSGSRTRQVLVMATALAVLPIAANAEDMIARFPMYLHVGPGSAYRVIDEVPTKAVLPVQGCQGKWCQVKFGAGYGWVSKDMLATPEQVRPAADQPATDCVDFARTGWPNSGDLERICYRNKPAK